MKHFIILVLLITISCTGYAVNNSDEKLLDLSIEELMLIKVTAQKREQNWYEVPATVDVYEGQQLRKDDIHHFRELAQQAPGLIYGRVGHTANLYVRGIGSDLLSVAADASTAVYVDDVYLARPEMAVAHFWDVERIEILKGPQGALYGRNATSGAINIVNARASFEKEEGYAHINVGSFNTREIESAYGSPLGDSVAIRASVFAQKNDGYTTDVDNRNGTTLDDTNAVAERIELRWKLNDQLESAISFDNYRNNNHGFSLKPADELGLAQQLGALDAKDIHNIYNDLPSFSDYQTKGASWRWIWMLDSMELQSITAYRALVSSYLLNTDGTEIAVTESQLKWNENQRTQEFRLVSTSKSNFRWLAGATWLHETPRVDVGLVRYPLNTSFVINSHANTTTYGVYGEVEWAFYSKWNTKLGLRESVDDRKDDMQLMSTKDLLGLHSSLQQSVVVGGKQRDDSFKHFSPQWVLSYTPDTDRGHSLWYLNVTDGFKAGGANSLSRDASFKPETIVSFETGYKHSDENLIWQLSAFHYDYENLQVSTFDKGVTTITNAATAKLNGVDASIKFAITSHWSWQSGVTALKANYGTFITAWAGAPRDVSGNTMPYAPEWDFNQNITYQRPLLHGQLELSLQHHFQAETYFNQFADDVVAIPMQHLYDINARWIIDKHWSVSGNIFNATNNKYYQNISRFTSTSIASAKGGNALGVAAPGRELLLGFNFQY